MPCHPRTKFPRATGWSIKAFRASLIACAAALATPYVASAQDNSADPSLEELIPDSAIENADEWAKQGTDEPASQPGEAAGDPAPETAADAPVDELADMAVEWPEDLEIPDIELLTPEEGIEFAAIEVGRPQITFADAETQALSDSLVLGFPQTEPPFTEREAFVARYEALSTIEELDNDGDENVAQLAARARQDETLLGNLLRVYGYYDGRIVRSIGAREAGQATVDPAPVVRFDIVQGPRYKVGTVNLGQLDTAPDAATLRAAFEIVTGEYLSSDKIVQEQFDLDRALGEAGYAFAEIDEPTLLIDHDRQEGDLNLPVRHKGKYAFGEVTSNDPAFLSGRHLARIARFDAGDTYKRSLSMDLRRAIVATGLVSSVTVIPREVSPPLGDQPGVVAMDVTMERAPLRTIAGAIGYGSNEGVRVQASWEHRNFFPPEGLIRFRGVIGTQEQLVGATFRKNNFGGRDRILNVDAYISTIDSPAFDANTAALVVNFERVSTLLFQKPIGWSIGFELIATDERPAPSPDRMYRPRQTYFIAAVPGYVQIDSTNDLLDPTRGYRVGLRLSPEASRSNGAESFYLRSRLDASYYQSVSDKIVMAGRFALGSIPGAALTDIAPSRRYYAGGGGSVRGYGYREIGPRNEFDEPSGGRSLVEAAIEARIRTGFMDGAVSVVPFLDAGSVGTGTTPDFEDIRVGAGVGVRYTTNFGPIRLDVATPLNPRPGDAPVAVYVSLGQAF